MSDFISNSENAGSVRNKLNGLKISSDVLDVNLTNIMDIKYATITTTWVGSTNPYTQIINVSGVLSTHNPQIYPIYSSDNNVAINEKISWNCVDKIVTGNGTITVTCFEHLPDTAINIGIKGV